MLVDRLHIYPIKSIAGLVQPTAVVTPRGLSGDRRYVLVDAKRRFMTGRQYPELVLVQPEASTDGWRLRAPGQTELVIARPTRSAPRWPITIWRDQTTGRHVSDAADAWFSRYLGTPCHLIYQDDTDVRPVAEAIGTRRTDRVSFADGYPVLLIGSASLDDLNARLAQPVSMGRFRTNIVAQTDTAFAEDRWRTIEVGEVLFDVVKRCARCVFTTVDPLSGQRDPNNEPLATLTDYRRGDDGGGVMFGVNLVPRSLGTVRAGDPIRVISRNDA